MFIRLKSTTLAIALGAIALSPIAWFGSACSALAECGAVSITSEPKGMPVFVNGALRGNTPNAKGGKFRIQLKPGEHKVEVREVKGDEQCSGSEIVFVSADTASDVALTAACGLTAAAQARKDAVTREGAARMVAQINAQMVTIPAGSFQMGSSNGLSDEKPVHQVQVRSFDVGKFEVTFDQWDACVAVGGCSHFPDDSGWGRGARPVMNVSWSDAQQFISWLNTEKGSSQAFRLPTEAEWEYAARAGAKGENYSTGACITTEQANFNDASRFENCTPSNRKYGETTPVGNFAANAFGLHDMHGNVWKWTQDCGRNGYTGTPSDGSAWTAENCGVRVLRGGSWYNDLNDLRSARRIDIYTGGSSSLIGFRFSRSR